MYEWSLNRIPQLNNHALTAILQSITQSTLGQLTPLALSAENPGTFASQSWQDLGCDADTVLRICHQYCAMFSAQVAPPDISTSPAALVSKVQQQWQDGPRLLIFFTSGSTGDPKPCTHPEELVRQEITSIAPLITGRKAALITAPLHHMYGFTFGLLLPLALRLPIRSLPPLPTVVAQQVQAQDLLVGIPLLWNRIAAGKAVQVQDVVGLTATAPTPPETFERAQAMGFSMIEFFGASETGAMCWRKQARVPFTLLPHFQQAKMEKCSNSIVRVLPNGSTRQYTLLDAIDWHDDRHLLPLKRTDEAVQVAGHNVFPTKVTAILAQHPDIAECTVRLMRPEEGDRLKAFVVPKADVNLQSLRKSLKLYVQQHLLPPEQPVTFTLGNNLPRSLTGKPVDWSLNNSPAAP